MKEKLGLFHQTSQPAPLTPTEQMYINSVQQETAEHSVTLIKDNGTFPLSPQSCANITVVPVSHYEPAFEEAELLCRELEARGFHVTYKCEGVTDQDVDTCDLLLYALFSRSFRPMGFLDFMGTEARKIAYSLKYGGEKTAVVSFGSPYFGDQYFERCHTYVNAYSMLAPSVKAFVRAATGEIEFGHFSPFRLQTMPTPAP